MKSIAMFLGVLCFVMLAGATIEQTYVQTLSRSGSSTIEKTMDLGVFGKVIDIQKIADYCKQGNSCTVDQASKKITLIEKFSQGSEYTFSSDYGLPFITYRMTLSRVSTDKFNAAFEKVLVATNATDGKGFDAGNPIELTDAKGNQELVGMLKGVKADIKYTITMPATIEGTNSELQTFDVVAAMESATPITVVSKELNTGYMAAIAGVVVLIGLMASFIVSKPKKKGAKTK